MDISKLIDMKREFSVAAITGALIIAPTTAYAQYDDAYEYEPGEGVHEEEWYDPSDWFDDDYYYEEGSVDYEENDWGYGGWAYDDEYELYEDDAYETTYTASDDYDYGWHYESFENDWEYGWHYDEFADYDTIEYDYDFEAAERDIDYSFNQTVRGEVTGMKKVTGAAYGEPNRVVLKLRTREGDTQQVTLGDVGYVSDYLQDIRKGDRIAIGGRTVERNDKQIFKAEEVRTRDSVYDIPEYEYKKTIRGKLTGLRKVRTQSGDVEAIIARVKDARGESRTVMLGQTQDLRDVGKSFQPNAEIRVDGYKRIADGDSTFVVTNVRVLEPADQQRQRQRDRQMQRRDREERRQMQQRPDRRQQNQRGQERAAAERY